MKYILFISAFLFISTQSFAQKAEKVKWYDYSSIEAKCSAKIPGKPDITEEEKENRKETKVLSMVNEQTHMVSFAIHNLDVSAEGIEKISMDSFVETLGGEVEESDEWKVGKHRGLLARIKMPEQDAICEYRVLTVGKIQYQVIVVSPKEAEDAKMAKKFFKSFKVKG